MFEEPKRQLGWAQSTAVCFSMSVMSHVTSKYFLDTAGRETTWIIILAGTMSAGMKSSFCMPQCLNAFFTKMDEADEKFSKGWRRSSLRNKKKMGREEVL